MDNLSPKQLKKEKQKCNRKSNKTNGNRGKRTMPQVKRLIRAKNWIAKYSGENILKAYRKHFVVDRMTALKDLMILGFTFTPEQIEKEKSAVQQIKQMKEAQKAKLMAKRETGAAFIERDDRFYFIAGYTSGGAPYGVTWEEMGLEPYENPDMKDEE